MLSQQGGGEDIAPFMLEDGGLNMPSSDLFVTDEPHVPALDLSGEYYPPNSFTEFDNQLDSNGQPIPIYCVCRQPEAGFMIGCEQCGEWYHGKCIGIDRELGERLPRFTCHTCLGRTSSARAILRHFYNWPSHSLQSPSIAHLIGVKPSIL